MKKNFQALYIDPENGKVSLGFGEDIGQAYLDLQSNFYMGIAFEDVEFFIVQEIKPIVTYSYEIVKGE